MAAPKFMFAGYPTAPVYKTKGGKSNIRELLWGDWVQLTGDWEGDWVPVAVRGTPGWMKKANLQANRCLEVIFLDVGQGDGCLMITPEDKHVLIDAGVSDNMLRFLRWRYAGFKSKWTFDAAIITHSDQDHYAGLQSIFEEPNVFFRSVYHNGIVERNATDMLGPSETDGGVKYLTDIIRTEQQLGQLLSDAANRGKKLYPKLLYTAFSSGRVDDIRSLATADDYVPGYGANQKVKLKILGPVLEPKAGKARLRWFPKTIGSKSWDVGKTKNGHSVILRLEYGNLRLLLGGDLNSPAEMFLLQHYAGGATDEAALRAAGRKEFGSDIAKCCHHGSADFTETFLEAVLPAATVISSGDEESHAHPRSDTLGTIGLYGRRPRPLIFSTELSRSARERESHQVLKKISDLRQQLTNAATVEKLRPLLALYDAEVDRLAKRNVTVYGAINLRTDGKKVVMAYRLEEKRTVGSKLAEWDIYRLEPDTNGQLCYVK
ncbi:MAG TPA: MBL fold metallo-hydrolase [Verrucomicrobiae bacterium]|nr:MBL fold metallo-hydrolase [Verrucomicrobiae bacterium]